VLQQVAVGTEAALQTDPVPLEMQIAAEALWAVFNIAVGLFLFSYLSSCQFTANMTVAWFLVGMRIIEGVAFVIYAINLKVDSDNLNKVFQLVQIGLHAPLLWAVAHYLRKHDRPKSAQATLSRAAPMTVLFCLVILVTDSTMGGIVSMVAFEPPLVLQLLYGLALWLASSRPTCKDARIKGPAAGLAIVGFVGYAAHIRHVIMLMDPALETMAGMVLQKLVEAGMISLSTWFTVRLAELHAFHTAGHVKGSPWETGDGSPLAERGLWWAASPERLWSYSFVFYAAAFIITFLSLVRSGWQKERDPIVGFYESVHPCILLDYLPGTLFAQPLFVCQILTIIVCMMLNFFRHIVEGSLFKILIASFGFCLAYIFGACFNLVFTFNPREVSVLEHSVPYMFNVAVQFIFIASETLCLFFTVNPHKVPLFSAYVAFVLGVCFFINFFMGQKLLRGHEKASKPMTQWTPEEMVFPEISTWNLWSALFVVFFLDFLFIMWYRVNPNSGTAIAFELGVTNREPDDEDLDDDVAGYTGLVAKAQEQPAGAPMSMCNVAFCKPIGMPMLFAVFWTLVGAFGCEFVNSEVHDYPFMDAPDRGWGETFSRYPGSGIMVVCWVFVITSIFAHVAGVVYYEELTNPSPAMRLLVKCSGFFVLLAALGAHAATIPGSGEWMLHDGPMDVCAALMVWTIVDLLLLCQDWPNLRPSNAVPNAVTGVILVVLLGLYAGKNLLGEVIPGHACLAGICGVLVLHIICDSKGAHVVLTFPRLIAVNADHGCWPPVWQIPPLLACGPGS